MGAEEAASLAAARSSGSGGGSDGLGGLEGSLADLSLSGMSGSSSAATGAAAAAGQRAEWYCCAYLAPEGSFCQRANTLQGFADVNRCGCLRAHAARSCCKLLSSARLHHAYGKHSMLLAHTMLLPTLQRHSSRAHHLGPPTDSISGCYLPNIEHLLQPAGCAIAFLVRLQPAHPGLQPHHKRIHTHTAPHDPTSPTPCRDVITPQNAPRVLFDEPNPRFENFVAGSVTVGTRANVSPATMVGPDSCLEERASVKRSVVGAGCHLGAGTKVRPMVAEGWVVCKAGQALPARVRA